MYVYYYYDFVRQQKTAGTSAQRLSVDRLHIFRSIKIRGHFSRRYRFLNGVKYHQRNQKTCIFNQSARMSH